MTAILDKLECAPVEERVEDILMRVVGEFSADLNATVVEGVVDVVDAVVVIFSVVPAVAVAAAGVVPVVTADKIFVIVPVVAVAVVVVVVAVVVELMELLNFGVPKLKAPLHSVSPRNGMHNPLVGSISGKAVEFLVRRLLPACWMRGYTFPLGLQTPAKSS